jgi:hypothetical protein
MKERQQIRPEWVPNAYKDEKPEGGSESSKAKTQLTAPLYSGKKVPNKNRISNKLKKP